MPSGAAGNLDDPTKRAVVADGDVGQDLAVDLDLGRPEAADELAVGHPVDPGRRVDPDDPELAEVTLPDLAVAGGIGERMEQRFVGRLDQPRAGPLAALGRVQEALVALVRGDAALDASHGLSLIHISEPTRLGMIAYAV